MILRLFRITYNAARLQELREFSREVSIRVFPHYAGCHMAYVAWTDRDWLTLSFWSNREFIASMERSPLYQDTVKQVTERQFFTGEPTIQIYDVSEVWPAAQINETTFLAKEASSMAMPDVFSVLTPDK